MRALVAASDVFAATRIRTILAKESLICDATDLGQDSLLLDRLYDYDIILLDIAAPCVEGYKLLQQLRAARVRTPSRRRIRSAARPAGRRRARGRRSR